MVRPNRCVRVSWIRTCHQVSILKGRHVGTRLSIVQKNQSDLLKRRAAGVICGLKDGSDQAVRVTFRYQTASVDI